VAKRDKQLLSSNFLKEIRKNCANLHKPQVIQIIHAIYIEKFFQNFDKGLNELHSI